MTSEESTVNVQLQKIRQTSILNLFRDINAAIQLCSIVPPPSPPQYCDPAPKSRILLCPLLHNGYNQNTYFSSNKYIDILLPMKLPRQQRPNC
jgi:hypothetical protein